MKVVITSPKPGTGIVAFPVKNLDAGNVKAFREAVLPVTNENGTVLIDMSELKFVDSSGLGALLACMRAMNSKNGRLRLFGMTKPVRALFELVRMHRIFEIFDTLEEAMDSPSET